VVVRQPRLRWPVIPTLNRYLTNQKIISVTRRAKYLIIELEEGHLLIHLGMSGSIKVIPKQKAQKHDHIDLMLSDNKVMRYHDPRRFGAFIWVDTALGDHPLLKDLGPEPLAKGFNQRYLFKSVMGRKRSIKQHLMDQHIVVGVGNIYANEALFLSGIDPQRIAQNISADESQILVKQIKQLLRKAIAVGGTTLRDFSNAQGKPGYFSQRLQVYGRADESCHLCGTQIKRIVQGQRATFFCPQCQQ
jgi:formamidopyrimidine-DNA glycosylase